jgi:hypothetical protein
MPTQNETLQLDIKDWQDLALLPEREGVARLAALYRELAREDGHFIQARLGDCVRGESGLSQADYRRMTRLRLLAWLDLEPRSASTVAMGHQAAMATMPAGAAMREVATIQSLVAEMPLAAQSRLRELIPDRILGGLAKSLVLASPPERKRAWWPGALWREMRQPDQDAKTAESAGSS